MIRNLLIRVVAVSVITLLVLVTAEIFLRVQNFVELDGFSTKTPWNPVLHHGTGKFVVTDFGSDCNDKKVKLLLLGDSWMEDESLSQAIGEEFVTRVNRCVQTINGGNSSYAPTTYLLRARQAFQKFGPFDNIIVNIDETDIGDEWLRYKIPTVRDKAGRIIAVPYEHDIASQHLWNGKHWAEDFPACKTNLFSSITVGHADASVNDIGV